MYPIHPLLLVLIQLMLHVIILLIMVMNPLRLLMAFLNESTTPLGTVTSNHIYICCYHQQGRTSIISPSNGGLRLHELIYLFPTNLRTIGKIRQYESINCLSFNL